jgi:hypothetical protein
MANVVRFETAKDIINAVAVECGLNSNTAPFNNQDPAFKQLIQLLNTCGRVLAVMPVWNSALRVHTFTTTTATEYNLPDDFMSMADATLYDVTNRQAAYGSASPQVWTIWQNENPSVTFKALFRLAQRKLSIAAGAIPAGTNVSFEYRSRAWVQSASSPTTFKDYVDTSGDVVLYEPVLMTRMLRYKFLEAKGFDTTAALAEFMTLMDGVRSADKPAEILDLTKNIVGSRFLDVDNLPDSGYGS